MARPSTSAVRLTTGEREPVRLATTGAITLSGLQTIDGVMTEVGDRILVKSQAAASANGIYTASAGEWFRASDARTARDLQKGTTVTTQQGTANARKIWMFETFRPDIGTDDIAVIDYLQSLVDIITPPSSGSAYVANRALLKVLDTTAVTQITLTEPLRAGLFVFRAGNYATQVALDTGEGIYIKANAIAATAGAWVRQYEGPIMVEWFGAGNANATTDTAAINLAFAMAQQVAGTVSDQGASTFQLNANILVKPGVKAFIGGGSTYKAVSTLGKFLFRGIHAGEATNISGFTMRNIRYDANDLALFAFSFQNISDSLITENNCINMNTGGALSFETWADGVTPTEHVVISNNIAVGRSGETGVGLQGRWYSIHLGSELNTPTAAISDPPGYYQSTGVAISASVFLRDCVVEGNITDGGYYGITMIAAQNCVVANNRTSNNTRGIVGEWNCLNNVVSGNRIYNNWSSGILFGYGCSLNQVVGNQITTTRWLGEALIKIGLKSERCSVVANRTLTQAPVATGEYHIYIHCDAGGAKVSENHLVGDCYKAYIGVETAWNPTVSDVRHFAAGKSNTNFAFAGMNDVVITDNLIDPVTTKSNLAAPDAIYLGAITDATRGALNLTDCVVSGNKVTNLKPVRQFSILEEAGVVNSLVMIDNEWERTAGIGQFNTPRGRAHCYAMRGNTVIDDPVNAVTFNPGDTTPSVSTGGGKYFNANANGAITFFTDGVDGQVIRVRGDATTSIVNNSSFIRLKGAVNASLANANNFITLEQFGSIWFETGRNF